jgi:hypothetical protein
MWLLFEEYYRVTYRWFAGNWLLVRLWKWYFQQLEGPNNLFDTWPALLRVIVQLKPLATFNLLLPSFIIFTLIQKLHSGVLQHKAMALTRYNSFDLETMR